MYIDVGSLKSCLFLRTNRTHLPLTTGSLGNLYMWMPRVNDLFWQLCWLEAPAMQIIGLVVSCLPYFPPYWIDLQAPKWRQPLLSHGLLAAQFECHFWGQNRTTLKACKIANFHSKHLKLWSRVFQTVYFKKMWKKISLHRHFNKILQIPPTGGLSKNVNF